MEPIKKAEELLKGFGYFTEYDDCAKNAAILCVDEIIKEVLSAESMNEINRKGYIIKSFTTKEYWKEVKQEINKL